MDAPVEVLGPASESLNGDEPWTYGDAPHTRTEIAHAVLDGVPAGWLKTDDGWRLNDDRSVRLSERQRLADLFEQHRDTLANFAPDGLSVEFVAFLLRLDHG